MKGMSTMVEDVSEKTSKDITLYRVVTNSESQYSLWAVNRDMPIGWQETGFIGSKQDCISHIDTVWTDMRPLSLQKAMAKSLEGDTSIA
jgi:MbtH protein